MGFIISDRGFLTAGPAAGRELIFLSHSPDEQHQIVLIPSDAPTRAAASAMSRSASTASARCAASTKRYARCPTQSPPVSRGNTWSVYFRDPENNRIEMFTQMPWHTTQPCCFDVNYDQDDAALKSTTEADARKFAGSKTTED